MRVTDDLFIDEADLSERFVLAQGPGGQNVNKVSSAVELRFDLARNRSLPEPVRLRLAAQARRYLAQSGEIILVAQRFRDQPRNRADARARLAALVMAAAAPPKERRATRPTQGSVRRRLQAKSVRAAVKAGRSWREGEDGE